MKMVRFLSLVVCVAILGLLGTTIALAGTYTESWSGAWFSQTFTGSVNKFDQSKGMLTSVKLTFANTSSLTVGFSNVTGDFQDWSASFGSAITFDPIQGFNPGEITNQGSASGWCGPYGTDGATMTQTPTPTAVHTFTSNADLAFFNGPGTFSISGSSMAPMDMINAPMLDLTTENLMAAASVTAEYTYSLIAIPEPSGVLALAGGLLSLGGLIRRRK